MANKTSRCPTVSHRTKTMIDMLSSNNKSLDEKIASICMSRDAIEHLHSRTYSMTTYIFSKFSETQNTYDSYHRNDLTNVVCKLNDIFPSKIIQDVAVPTTNNNIEENLYCSEIMPPPSPTPCSPVTFDFDSDDSVKDKNYEPPKKYSDSSSSSTVSSPIPKATENILLPSPKPVYKTQNATVKIDPMLNKRKKYNISLKERIIEKQINKRRQYDVKPGCGEKCIKKCSLNYCFDDRQFTNKSYWSMSRSEQRLFIRTSSSVAIPKRKYSSEPKRNPRRTYTLKKSDGTVVSVCKTFYLTTLGFDKNNDKILYNSLDATKDCDRRGKHVKTPGFDRDLISSHIESFQPSAPHYRREHAPNRRYLPNEINITFMYKDFCEKYPENKIGYELYRNHLKKMNISFTRLGHEECEVCESYSLHQRDTSHKDIVPECNSCVEYNTHRQRYIKARQHYDLHKTLEQNEKQKFFSADLEKVIMLPRLDTFKAVIFCPRLAVYNQTFAPVGKITKELKPLAVIWHDGIAGRKQEDIMSAFYNFFLRYRDVETINIWLDNCSAQNKNWLFYSMLIDLINSDLIITQKIILHYFEPGHTFMSCDQFHHQVELAMKKKAKIYDFTDFENTVASANNGKVVVKSLQPQDFLNYPNNVSERRIQNSSPRAYLKNMTQVCFQRTVYDLHYKNNFDDDYITLRFLKDSYLRNPTSNMTFRTTPKGIERERKLNIIQKLSSIIPTHKLMFWQNMPVSNDERDCEKKATEETSKTARRINK